MKDTNSENSQEKTEKKLSGYCRCHVVCCGKTYKDIHQEQCEPTICNQSTPQPESEGVEDWENSLEVFACAWVSLAIAKIQVGRDIEYHQLKDFVKSLLQAQAKQIRQEAVEFAKSYLCLLGRVETENYADAPKAIERREGIGQFTGQAAGVLHILRQLEKMNPHPNPK